MVDLIHNLEYYLLDFSHSVMYAASNKNIKAEIIIEEINTFDAQISDQIHPSEAGKGLLICRNKKKFLTNKIRNLIFFNHFSYIIIIFFFFEKYEVLDKE